MRFLPLLFLLLLVPQHQAHAALITGSVGYWKFDENTGTTAADASGNGNTGTLSTISAGSIPTWINPAKINAGLNFNGSSAYVNIPDATILNPSSGVTYNAWVRGSSFPNAYNTIMHKGIPGPTYVEYYVKSNGKIAMYLSNGASYDGTGATTLSANTWYMVTLTYDTTQGLIGYVNGSSDGSFASNTSTPVPTGSPLDIGRDSQTAGRLWSGDIDEPGVWNRALTAAEVTSLYNGGSGLQYPFSTALPHAFGYNLIKMFVTGFGYIL